MPRPTTDMSLKMLSAKTVSTAPATTYTESCRTVTSTHIVSCHGAGVISYPRPAPYRVPQQKKKYLRPCQQNKTRSETAIDQRTNNAKLIPVDLRVPKESEISVKTEPGSVKDVLEMIG